MPNKPRPENPARPVRVEDDLWRAAGEACAELGTTRSAVIREALIAAVREAEAVGRARRAAFNSVAEHLLPLLREQRKPPRPRA